MGAFTMPSLGADMDRGRLIEWLVGPGDTVHRGDLVAVVDTAKSEIEVESFEDGVIGELLVEPGTEVPVGTPLATLLPIGTRAARAAHPAAPAPGSPAAARPEPIRPEAVEAEPPATPREPVQPSAATTVAALAGAQGATPPGEAPAPTGGRERTPRHTASPLVRRIAAEHGLDIARVHASGPDGRVTREDVERAAAQLTVRPKVSPHARRLAAELGVDLTLLTPGDDDVIRAEHVRRAASSMAQAGALEPPSAPVIPGPVATAHETAPETAHKTPAPTDMRTAIARLMARSKREIPHYYLATTVDLGSALDWMRARNRDLPVEERLVPAALVLKAIALAAKQRPEVNGFWVDDAFAPGAGVHLGVAISLRGGGLVAPAIHDAADLGLAELMGALRDLVARARAGRLRRAELADPTLTVTNLGDQGVEAVHGIIHPPQVALVGVGRVVERPWAVNGLIGVRPVTTLTLAADHRATDGFTGSRYLDTIDRLLQEPEAL